MKTFEKIHVLHHNGKTITNPQDLALFPDTAAFYSGWINNASEIEVNTSGSTGAPKTITLLKRAMCISAQQTIDFFGLQANQNFLLCLPTAFIAGKMMLVRAMLSGANVIEVKPVANPLKNVTDTIHFAAFTPYQVSQILKDEESASKFASIQNIIIGGGEIPHTIEKKLQGFNNNIYATYGMTETITHIALRRVQNPLPVFKAFKGIALGQDARGCLTIQALYLGNEPIVTNDVVVFEGPREFMFVGRYDNVINSGGIKLHAEAIENKIRDIIPFEFFITGLLHAELGQQVVLVIESQVYDKTTLKLLESSLADVLTKYELPKQILFTVEFKHTPTGKINKTQTMASFKLA